MFGQQRVVRTIATGLIVALLLAGCGSDDSWGAPRVEPVPSGTLGVGFFDPDAPPPPEGTINPVEGSWDGVDPPAGYRVVLLTAGDDEPTAVLSAAVEAWAGAEGVRLRVVHVDGPDDHVAGIVRAMELGPDLIVSASASMTPALDLVTANHLDQQFLVVGAQLSEPTVNVTAVIWAGASAHDGAAPAPRTALDPGAFTPDRAGRAIRAGVASVLSDLTGIVVVLS